MFIHLAIANMNAYPISYPTVPKGAGRIRLVFHAHNSEEDIDRLIAVVADWVTEMRELAHQGVKDAVPAAMRMVYAMQPSLLK